MMGHSPLAPLSIPCNTKRSDDFQELQPPGASPWGFPYFVPGRALT